MRVAAETMTILTDPKGQELTLVMNGYRIILTHDEARALVDGVGNALHHTARGDDEPAHFPLSARQGSDGATIAARVAEQVISWAQITESLTPKK